MSTNPQEEVWSAQLVAACQAGRSQRWAELVTELHPTLLRIALSLVSDNLSVTFTPLHTAEDLVSETLVRLWKNIHTIDPSRPLEPWLKTVMRRVLLDNIRTARVRVPEYFAGPDEEFDNPSTQIEARPDDVCTARDAIVPALRALSAVHREVLLDTFWLGLTPTEIAARRGYSVGTVKSRLHYALRNLRIDLEGRGYQENLALAA